MRMVNITYGSDETTVILREKIVTINNVDYKKPGKDNNLTNSDGNIYVNGFKFKNGKFRRSLAAIYHNYLDVFY